ncbi:hypothetical protein KP509_07G060500 [Ceratopteris richardii]|uniref:Uncharacterized protein n=1 Tax=Ceratopteris richardii TaxID=49495 RepID=A0A8T2UBC3_CERRI|nr:hypothetical protein KP509_07G060500 [Ceratopteris richardii]
MTRAVAPVQSVAQQWRAGLIGLFLGMCVTYLLQVTPSVNFLIPFNKVWDGDSSLRNSYSQQASKGHKISNFNDSHFQALSGDALSRDNVLENEKLKLLLSAWELSDIFFSKRYGASTVKSLESLSNAVPVAPHLEHCHKKSLLNEELDSWGVNGTLPYWNLWKGEVYGLHMNVPMETGSTLYPPWVEGSDEDNLPLTRQVQTDIWKHQHPCNCQNASLRFLLADWETDPGFGMGAQFASMAGMLAIAMNEQRILVTKYYDRADHEDCLGSNHAQWSCYFLSETSEECRNRAFSLASQPSAWADGLITGKNNYTSKQIWVGKTPRKWGEPWKAMQPTTQINGKMLIHHKAADRRWWRAQAIRYLMRFPSKYTCFLLNEARHKAFGVVAAKMVLDAYQTWPKESQFHNETDIDKFVWSAKKPWMPRPLVSIHVRQGDKAKEMELFGFEDYMKLAQHLRRRFPEIRNIWLSTEMQVRLIVFNSCSELTKST